MMAAKIGYAEANGQFPNRIEETVKEINGLGSELMVSVDGPRELHDKIRGQGTFKKAVNALKNARNFITTKLGFTITPENYHKILWAYGFAKSVQARFSLHVVQPLEKNIFSEEQLQVVSFQLERLAEEMLKTRKLGKAVFSYWYYKNIVEALRRKRRGDVPCWAGVRWLVLDPFGDVYPCFSSSWGRGCYGNPELRAGNIKNGLSSERLNDVVKRLRPWDCEKCYNMCDIHPAFFSG